MINEIILLTIIIEITTISGRIFFGSARENYKKSKFRYKIRIHHGYFGLILIGIYFLIRSDILLIIGLALLISDVIHHFIILPLWIKRTEFP